MAPFGDRGARRPIDLVVFNGTRRTVHVHSGDNLAIKVLSSESCSTNASSNTVTLVEAGGQPAEIKLYTKRFRCKARKLDVPASCTCLVYQQRVRKRKYHLLLLSKIETRSWMSGISDDKSVASLYLPGTHETMAFWGGPISCCQTPALSLTHQLIGGVRFIDVRLALKADGQLRVYHGIQDEYAEAEKDVFEPLYAFLEASPTETVVVSIKQENATAEFEATVWNMLDKRTDKWYRENRWPALGEVRGRAIVFCRFGFVSEQGLHPVTWPNNAPEAFLTDIGGELSAVQDWYSIGSFIKIPEKAAVVLSLFRRREAYSGKEAVSLQSRRYRPSGRLEGQSALLDGALLASRINFCSGATLLTAFPFIVAKGLGFSLLGFQGVNERVLEGLTQMTGDAIAVGARAEPEGCPGMALLLDFWEFPRGLVELLIAWNLL